MRKWIAMGVLAAATVKCLHAAIKRHVQRKLFVGAFSKQEEKEVKWQQHEYAGGRYLFVNEDGVLLEAFETKMDADKENRIRKNTCKLLIYFSGNKSVLRHGGIQHLEQMHQAINPEKYHCATFAYQGYGHSRGSPTIENIVKDAAHFVRLMKSKYDATKVVLYGRSLGGYVAAKCLALLEEDDVESLFLEVPMLGLQTIAGYQWLAPWVGRLFVPEVVFKHGNLESLAVMLARNDAIIDNGKVIQTIVPTTPALMLPLVGWQFTNMQRDNFKAKKVSLLVSHQNASHDEVFTDGWKLCAL